MLHNQVKNCSYLILFSSLWSLFGSSIYYVIIKNKYSAQICDIKLCERFTESSIKIYYYLYIKNFTYQSHTFIHNTNINYHCNSTIPCHFNNYKHGISIGVSDNDIFLLSATFVSILISIFFLSVAIIMMITQIIYVKYFITEYDLGEDEYILNDTETSV